MEAVIRKCGNSPALGYQLLYGKKQAINLRKKVDLLLFLRRIFIKPSARVGFNLDTFLGSMNKENIYDEVSFHSRVGKMALW